MVSPSGASSASSSMSVRPPSRGPRGGQRLQRGGLVDRLVRKRQRRAAFLVRQRFRGAGFRLSVES
jgi:hypothetical protein